ncbi:MAG TPA: type I phosphomannose isomerase catalytic subunit [Bacteroidales bacterium]|jgi:mannose-6-phosphate isomerase|nr:type I phosphomannose isomerase catalytic subunit [Bacteroidales bacterium]
MSDLYPLKFEPVLKEKIWGGRALAEHYNKKAGMDRALGESWEISAVTGDISVVTNGFLAGNSLEELIEVYMGDITGDSVYEKFGNEFPLLIKFIEAGQDLSVQVHPGNEIARKKHNAYGKTEMWYILESKKGALIYTGFREGVTKEMYQKAVEDGTIAEFLNAEEAEPGDVFFTPAGRVHAIGKGIVLVEIQQTSDITYRIFDWNRKGAQKRELHTELALEVIDFSQEGKNKVRIEPETNRISGMVSCEFFNTDILKFDTPLRREYYLRDSFVIYICTEGAFKLKWEGKEDRVIKGDTILLPAMIKEVILEPELSATILEVYIDEETKYI